MLLTTTPNIEGYPVKNYLGLVCGEVISGVDFVKVRGVEPDMV